MASTHAAPVKQKLADFLNRTLLFRGLDEPVREKIASVLAIKSFPAGTTIIRQGENSDALYIISAGACAVLVDDPRLGLQQHIAELSQYDAFGEMGLLLTEQRSATVATTTDTTCLVLSRDAFQRIVLSLPKVSLTISQNLARRLQEQSKNVGFRFIRLLDYKFDSELYSMFPAAVLERHQMVPVEMDRNTLVVAMTRPNDPGALEALRSQMAGVKIRPLAVAEQDYNHYLNAVIRAGQGGVASAGGRPNARAARFRPQDLQIMTSGLGSDDRNRSVRMEVQGETVIKLMNEIIVGAINRGASDIHIEGGREQMRVRLRINGRLIAFMDDVPERFHAPLVSRIKVTSGMDISIKRTPQDGRISLRLADLVYDLRVSTLPSLTGEKVVMRVLDANQSSLPLDKLILSVPLASVVRKAVFKPTGCVLVVGPTGSGKTTTLYSSLNERNRASSDLNICTIEDPIEYSIDGVTQTQVNQNQGLDFPQVLRALLRQDPDVMMVGEMRDALTAQIALEGALTGHLVLSTLHANGAPEALTRLVEMDCEPYLVGSSVTLVVAQRLVRQVCPACRRPHTYSDVVRNHLELAGIMPFADSEHLPKGAGCDRCFGTGYEGRVGVYEVLQITDPVRDAVARSEPANVLREVSVATKSITTFKQYSAFLLSQGFTTPTEILRSFGT